MTSCYRGEGVSTIAMQSAISAAGSGNYNVLLVDANLGGPALHSAFGLSLSPGLAEVLCQGAQCRSAVQQTRLGNLSVLSAGSADIAGVYEAVDRVNALLGELKKDFDLVVFDKPAAGQVPSALQESATGLHDMGYCKHEWQARSEQLRAVFNGNEHATHEFLVCQRCLKIREVEAEAELAERNKGDSGVNAA